jgi:uncharacterized membrane protein
MIGFEWPRLHAALNDLPAALLLVSVVFDLIGGITKRDSLRAAGFWTLIAGVLGAGAAVVSGLLAEDVVEHSDRAHAVMETHETLAFIVLVLFGLLALWRLVRRGVLSPKEQPVALTAGVIGVALMAYTARLGGTLVFDHGTGISSATMEAIRLQRAAENVPHEHAPADSAKAPSPADSAKAAHDSIPHSHGSDSTKR